MRVINTVTASVVSNSMRVISTRNKLPKPSSPARGAAAGCLGVCCGAGGVSFRNKLLVVCARQKKETGKRAHCTLALGVGNQTKPVNININANLTYRITGAPTYYNWEKGLRSDGSCRLAPAQRDDSGSALPQVGRH